MTDTAVSMPDKLVTAQFTATSRSVFKWAGGKFSVLEEIAAHMPDGQRLIEPFVGGGSVFMNLNYSRYLCADLNPDLITTYRTIKNAPDLLFKRLQELFAIGNEREKYLEIRDRFNLDRGTQSVLMHAAHFIYLNRHCFNGLMRYNMSGMFNVGFGDYKCPYLPESELKICAERAQRAEFHCLPFADTIARAGSGDVIFCDPPYEPLPKTEGFTQYATGRFTMEDQESLVLHLKAAKERGSRAVITNSSAPLVVELYNDHGLKIHPLRARRNISSKATTRAYANDIIAIM